MEKLESSFTVIESISCAAIVIRIMLTILVSVASNKSRYFKLKIIIIKNARKWLSLIPLSIEDDTIKTIGEIFPKLVPEK